MCTSTKTVGFFNLIYCHFLHLGDPCQYLLHKMDDKTGDKKFYKIQLLESDDGGEWRVFRRYGVVLTDSTKDMINNFDELDDALKLFEG